MNDLRVERLNFNFSTFPFLIWETVSEKVKLNDEYPYQTDATKAKILLIFE